MKWRIAALTALLLIAFAALLAITAFVVLQTSLEQHQDRILEEDAGRLLDLFSRGEPGEARIGTRQGGIRVGLYDTDGSWFDGARLIPEAEIRVATLATNGSSFWRGRSEGVPYRALIQPTELCLGQIGCSKKILVVAAETSYIRDALAAVGTATAVVALGLILLALGGGYWAASFGLRPLVRVSRQAQQLSEANLVPLEYTGPRDELGVLTNTLNRFVVRLSKAFQAQKEFLAETSHELRTPLTALEGYLRRSLRTATRERAILEDALRIAQSMTRLVSDLLQLSRGEVVREFVPHLVDLTNLVEQVAKEFPGIQVERTKHLELIGDPDRLTQLVRNLVANAIRAATRQENVLIRLERHQELAEIHVIDDGPGIPHELRDKVFDKFYRGPGGGSGLGLAIVAQIARVHNGSVEIRDSEQGAHIVVQLPTLIDESDDG